MSGEKMKKALMDNGRKAIYGVMRLARSLGNVGWATFSKLYVSMVSRRYYMVAKYGEF